VSENLEAAYAEIVETVARRIAVAGFAKRGKVLRVVRDGNCGLIEFQKSTKSSKNKLFVTVNLGVVCGDLLEGGTKLEKTTTIDAHLRLRIGMFLPQRRDKWWELAETKEAAGVASEIGELVHNKAVPFIEQHIANSSLLAMWESGVSPGLTDFQRLQFLEKLRRKGISQ